MTLTMSEGKTSARIISKRKNKKVFANIWLSGKDIPFL